MIGAYTRGVLFVHSAPRALCPHIEWAAAEVLGSRVHLDWTEQPAARGMMRAETSWVGPAGTGASLASALRGWANLRYEVTEEASVGTDGGQHLLRLRRAQRRPGLHPPVAVLVQEPP